MKMIPIIALAVHASTAQAGLVGTTGTISLYGTGLDANLESNNASAAKAFTFDTTGGGTGQFTLFEPSTVTSYTGTKNADGTVNIAQTFVSSAVIKNELGKLGAYYKLTVSPGYFDDLGGPVGYALVRHNDEISLRWNRGGTAPPLPFGNLVVKYDIDAQIHFKPFGEGTPSEYLDGAINITAYLGYVNSINYNLGRSDLLNFNSGATSLSVSPTLQLRIDPIRMQTSFAPGLQISIGGSAFNTLEADGLNTMSLASITFPDGTTPESRGYDIVFASGMASPNVSLNAVPEPSTLALAGLGCLLGPGGYLRRRSRSQHAPIVSS